MRASSRVSETLNPCKLAATGRFRDATSNPELTRNNHSHHVDHSKGSFPELIPVCLGSCVRDFRSPKQSRHPQGLQRQPAKDDSLVSPQQLHIRDQRWPARGGPFGARSAQAVRRALLGAWHATNLRRHPGLPRTQPPAHPHVADRKRLLQAVRIVIAYSCSG